MAETPKLKPSISKDGMNVAAFDAIVAFCRAIWTIRPQLKDEFSIVHPEVAEHGSQTHRMLLMS